MMDAVTSGELRFDEMRFDGVMSDLVVDVADAELGGGA